MNEQTPNRRTFVKQTSVAAMTALSASRVIAANEKVRIAHIGLGGRGTTLLKNILRIPDFEIVALCDLRQDRLDRAMGVCGEEGRKPKTYTDFESMLEKEQLDGVICATEVANHAKVVIPVLEAGLNCFSEKPMDATVEKVDAIVKAARKAKGIYQVGFQRRYNPTFHEGIKLAQSNQYGDIMFLQGHWFFSGGMGNGGWVRNVDMSGGKLVEQACHHMDVFTWVMNDHPIQCQAMGRITFDHIRNVEHLSEDHSSLNFYFKNGVILSYSHFALLPPQFNNEKLWVMKKDGLLSLNEGIAFERKDPKTGDPKQYAEETDYYKGTYDEFVGFARHIRNGEKPLSNVETARISTLTALMGHQAMYNRAKQQYEPSMIEWKDIGTTTDLA